MKVQPAVQAETRKMALGVGVLTVLIRYFGSYPEGVSFAILIMNSVVPLLNMWFHQKKFGRK